jgi:hypothetical protein
MRDRLLQLSEVVRAGEGRAARYLQPVLRGDGEKGGLMIQRPIAAMAGAALREREIREARAVLALTEAEIVDGIEGHLQRAELRGFKERAREIITQREVGGAKR